MHVKLIAITQPIELQNVQQLIEYAGRKCTATTEKTGQNTDIFIKARVKQKHLSILEHVNFTFEIDGISRACLAQLTRHRIASFSVQSMRYVKQDEKCVTIPQSILDNKLAHFMFVEVMNYCYQAYCYLMSTCNIPKQDARFVLSLATQTNLIMTMNLRSLLNFFELRSAEAAQWEIQELSNTIREIVKEYVPNVFA